MFPAIDSNKFGDRRGKYSNTSDFFLICQIRRLWLMRERLQVGTETRSTLQILTPFQALLIRKLTWIQQIYCHFGVRYLTLTLSWWGKFSRYEPVIIFACAKCNTGVCYLTSTCCGVWWLLVTRLQQNVPRPGRSPLISAPAAVLQSPVTNTR